MEMDWRRRKGVCRGAAVASGGFCGIGMGDIISRKGGESALRGRSEEKWIQSRRLILAILYSYNTDMKVSVADAKNKLPKLIRAAEQGEQVTICRHGKPVVDLVRTAKPERNKPKLGTLKGKIIIHDPDWWKPMSDEEVNGMLGPTK